MKFLVNALLGWPQRTARHLDWLGPLVARIVVGYVFMLSGWGKLNNLPQVTENFISWGIPLPQLLTPLTSAIEFLGGLLLILGLLTRISAGALGVVMIVAIKAAKWEEVDSLETLLGFEETTYFAVFLWLAIAGAGRVALDPWVQRRFERPSVDPDPQH
ncbi:MAG TPA: DoxX family protein [Steroidobacteraceae bacterium]|jgi:putative oxidoreductase